MFGQLLKTLSLDTIETIQAAVQKLVIQKEKYGYASSEYSLIYYEIIIDISNRI